MPLSVMPADADARREAEDYLRMATGLTALLIPGFSASYVAFALTTPVIPQEYLPYLLTVSAAIFTLSLVGYLNARRGYRWVSSNTHFMLLSGIIAGVVTEWAYLGGSTSLPTLAWYPLLTVIGTLYISPRAGIFTLLIGSAMHGGVIALEAADILQHAPFMPQKRILRTIPALYASTAAELTITNLSAFVFAYFIARELYRRRVAVDTANRRLRALDEAKNRFLSVVSHDLRTPITSIKAYGELVGETATGENKHFMQTIVTEADRLNRLVTDLLDLDKMEAGKMDWNRQTQNIRPLLEASAQIFRAAAADKKIELVEEYDEQLPDIRADRDRISQLVANLLSNAIKFTPQGGTVTIAAHTRTAGAPPSLEIAVTDTGPGIPPGEVEDLFDRYTQTETGKQTGGGTGLGLAIAREIAHGHGGDISVESAVGAGTAFTVTLPVAYTPGA